MSERAATLLDPTLTRREVLARATAALKDAPAALVCLSPWAADLADLLDGSETRLCVAVGYPSGVAPAGSKTIEAAVALADGASELLLYPFVAALRSGVEAFLLDDLVALAEAVQPAGATLAVRVPGSEVSDFERGQLVRLAAEVGVDALLVPQSAALVAAGRAVLDDEIALWAEASAEAGRLALVEAGADRVLLPV